MISIKKKEKDSERKVKSRRLRKTLHQNHYVMRSFVTKFADFLEILPTSMIRK